MSASSLQTCCVRLLLSFHIVMTQCCIESQQKIDMDTAPQWPAPQYDLKMATHYFEVLLVFADDTVHLRDVFYQPGKISGQRLHVGDHEFTLTALDSVGQVAYQGYFKDPRIVYYDVADSTSGALSGGMITRDTGTIALRLPFMAGRTIEYRIMNPDSTIIWKGCSAELLEIAQRTHSENEL